MARKTRRGRQKNKKGLNCQYIYNNQNKVTKETDMKTGEIKNKYGRICGRIAALTLAMLLAVVSLPVNFAFAAADSEKSIREVHKVNVAGKYYCFFVTHYVVITPAEIAKFGDDDEKLTDEILKRAGLYMKEHNCRLAVHKAIEPAAWKKTGGEMFLGDVEIYEEATPEEGGEGGDNPDGGSGDATAPPETSETSGGTLVKMPTVEALRKAAHSDGNPVRLEMDLEVTTEKQKEGSDDKPTRYSTYKKSSPNTPKLIYIAVATDADAKLGEDICKEEASNNSSNKSSTKKAKTVTPKAAKEEKEILPEERTISMTDRSGGPLEPTLKDGDPVTLEWREPGKQTDGSKKLGFFDHAWAVPALIAAALAIILAVVFIIRKKDEEETEE